MKYVLPILVLKAIISTVPAAHAKSGASLSHANIDFGLLFIPALLQQPDFMQLQYSNDDSHIKRNLHTDHALPPNDKDRPLSYIKISSPYTFYVQAANLQPSPATACTSQGVNGYWQCDSKNGLQDAITVNLYFSQNDNPVISYTANQPITIEYEPEGKPETSSDALFTFGEADSARTALENSRKNHEVIRSEIQKRASMLKLFPGKKIEDDPAFQSIKFKLVNNRSLEDEDEDEDKELHDDEHTDELMPGHKAINISDFNAMDDLLLSPATTLHLGDHGIPNPEGVLKLDDDDQKAAKSSSGKSDTSDSESTSTSTATPDTASTSTSTSASTSASTSTATPASASETEAASETDTGTDTASELRQPDDASGSTDISGIINKIMEQDEGELNKKLIEIYKKDLKKKSGSQTDIKQKNTFDEEHWEKFISDIKAFASKIDKEIDQQLASNILKNKITKSTGLVGIDFSELIRLIKKAFKKSGKKLTKDVAIKMAKDFIKEEKKLILELLLSKCIWDKLDCDVLSEYLDSNNSNYLRIIGLYTSFIIKVNVDTQKIEWRGYSYGMASRVITRNKVYYSHFTDIIPKITFL